ncbi:hypothetical protein ABZP36_004843 [Zizania latifolia]
MAFDLGMAEAMKQQSPWLVSVEEARAATSLIISLPLLIVLENRSAAVQSVSPSLASPVSSDSNGLALSPCPAIARYRDWPYAGDLQEVVSALVTATAI